MPVHADLSPEGRCVSATDDLLAAWAQAGPERKEPEWPKYFDKEIKIKSASLVYSTLV